MIQQATMLIVTKRYVINNKNRARSTSGVKKTASFPFQVLTNNCKISVWRYILNSPFSVAFLVNNVP